jgi:hypothetical protein
MTCASDATGGGNMNHGVFELGRGVLDWCPEERRSDRYGTVILHETAAGNKPVNLEMPSAPYGRFIAEVLESRRSYHVGDIFRAIYPAQPVVGARLVLGTGTFFCEEVSRGLTAVGVWPADGRDSDWLEPTLLYQAHHQTVRLTFEAATEPHVVSSRTLPTLAQLRSRRTGYTGVSVRLAAAPRRT